MLLLITAALEPSTIEQRSLQEAAGNSYKLDQQLATVVNRLTTEDQRWYIANAGAITQVIVERKIVLKWSW